MHGLSILFIDQFRDVAGGQVVLQAMVKNARDEGLEVGVLAPMGGGLEAALSSRWGSNVALYDLKQLDLENGEKGVRDIVRLIAYCVYVLRFWRLASRYQVIYVNGCRVAPAFMLLSLLLPWKRWLYHVHLCHSRLEKFVIALISLLPSTHEIVFASSFIGEDFFRSIPWLRNSRRFVVLENCLSPAFANLPFVDRFSEGQSNLTVALIGRVSPEKGHAVLPRLARHFPSVHFLIIGRTVPAQASFLHSLLEERLPNLIYLGETSHLPKLLEEQHVQISIVPSRWQEAFGLTSIESMAASCVTLVSHNGMLASIAKRTGAPCFDDDDQLEKLLEQMVESNPVSLRKLARTEYESVHSQFGTNIFSRRFISLVCGLSPAAA